MTTTNSMNAIAGFGKMLKKTYLIGILTASTLGVLPLAAQANPTPQPCCQSRSGDNAVVQTSEQNASVDGKGNSLSQNANQSANNRGGSSARVRPAATNSKRPVRTHVRRPAPAPATCPTPVTNPCKK